MYSQTVVIHRLNVEYVAPYLAVLTWSGDGPWDQFRGLLLSYSNSTRLLGSRQASLPWAEFTGLISEIRNLRAAFPFEITYAPGAAERIADAVKRQQTYKTLGSIDLISAKELDQLLDLAGFSRELTEFQMRNVRQLLRLPAGATFSVPGAGKTTEALAFFFAKARNLERLLVTAPKNAFATWEEQLSLCVPSVGDGFVRLRGGDEKITALLEREPRFMLITYQQLTRVREVVSTFLAEHPTIMFLDESHRIKSGHGVTAETVLSMSHLPALKLVMSGTPMPQDESDLLPQFSFLFPEIDARQSSPASLINPIYVRTTKEELGLRPPDVRYVTLPMNPLQFRLYELLRYETQRQAAGLSLRSQRDFRQLGRSIMRLLQFCSNPVLLAEELGEMHPELMRAVVKEGDGPKLSWTCERVRRLVKEQKRVIVWTSFVRNVELLASRLIDLGTEFIHGGVDSGDEDEFDTREAKIKRFHDASMVLVANPAAASEGVSLHQVCHHAIFLDRTFNAAHYMQAEDRIHRLGLAPTQSTTIEIVECKQSIDEVVRARLNAKIARMAQVLNDRSIHVDPIPIDDVDIEFDESGGLSEGDVDAVMAHLRGSRWHPE